MVNDICILLTACIEPGGMIYTALHDSIIRRNQYIDAIKWYLVSTPYHIVFSENSGNDISSYFVDYTDRVEFITFEGNNFDKKLGKGYGEYEILKYTKEHSKTLHDYKYIVKITGRLKVINICAIIDDFFNDAKNCVNPCYVDFRTNGASKLWSMMIIGETNTLLSQSFFKQLECVNDFEHV